MNRLSWAAVLAVMAAPAVGQVTIPPVPTVPTLPAPTPVPAAMPAPPAAAVTTDPCPVPCPLPCPVPCPTPHRGLFARTPCPPAPGPRITIVMSPPEVVRPCDKPSCREALTGRPAAPAAAPVLVPQMSYSMQPVVTMQPVVSMQAVPTVSFGVAGASGLSAFAAPGAGFGAFAAPGFGLSAFGVGPTGVGAGFAAGANSNADTEALRLLRSLLSARAVSEALGADKKVDKADAASALGLTGSDVDAQIRRLDAEIAAVRRDLGKRIDDLDAGVKKELEVVGTDIGMLKKQIAVLEADIRAIQGQLNKDKKIEKSKE